MRYLYLITAYQFNANMKYQKEFSTVFVPILILVYTYERYQSFGPLDFIILALLILYLVILYRKEHK